MKPKAGGIFVTTGLEFSSNAEISGDDITEAKSQDPSIVDIVKGDKTALGACLRLGSDAIAPRELG